MGYRVTIEPSGHQFENEAGETLLESALRSGIAISYHCSSGSCGECHSRLVEGELAEADFHDYHFTEQQIRDGEFLLCRNYAASDLVISANEINDPASIPLQTINTKVYNIDHPNDQYLILQLRTPRSHTLQFLAGQTVKLTIPELESYSIAVASCPCNGMTLQFHINLNHPHPFVQRLREKEKDVGKIVVEGPFGEHILNVQYDRPIIFIAKDSEFGAIKSLIEQAINLELPQPIRLFWIASDSKNHYMNNYCRAWRELLDDYHFKEIDQRDGETIEQALAVIAAELEHDEADMSNNDSYIATPFNDLYRAQVWWQMHINNVQNIYLMTENRDRYAHKPKDGTVVT